MTTPAPVEFLYGVRSGRYDANDDWQPAHVVRFPVTKKTPKRVYYDARQFGSRYEIRFVDRHRLETDGEVRRRSGGYWEPDLTVYLNPPVIEQQQVPDVAGLKAEMAAAHPDRGGTDAAFIAARRRYEQALGREAP